MDVDLKIVSISSKSHHLQHKYARCAHAQRHEDWAGVNGVGDAWNRALKLNL